MAIIHFTSALKRYNKNLKSIEAEGTTIKEILFEVEKTFPGLTDYLVDERGVLRIHVNIFVNGKLILDRKTLSDSVNPNDEIHIIQALSGG